MIRGIVLAAGESRRMGTNKLLLPYGERTVIARVVSTALESEVGSLTVVVGHQRDLVEKELISFPVNVAFNPDYPTGMLGSIRCGLEALPPETEAVALFLGDQPALSSEIVNEVIRAYRAQNKGILVPVFEGSRGHPLLFSSRYFPRILSSFDEEGLRGLLRAYPEEVSEVEMEQSEILRDMDRMEDYQRELRLRSEAGKLRDSSLV